HEYGVELGARVPLAHADLYRLLELPSMEDEIAELGLRAKRGEGWALVVEHGGAHIFALGGDALVVTLHAPRGPSALEAPSVARRAELSAEGARGAVLRDAIARAISASSSFD